MSKIISNAIILVDKFYQFGGGEIFLQDLLSTCSSLKIKAAISIEKIKPTYQSFPIPVFEIDKIDLDEIQKNIDYLIFWGRVLDAPDLFKKIPKKIIWAHSDYNVGFFMDSAKYADLAIACSSSVRKAINFSGNCEIIIPGINWKRFDVPLERNVMRKILSFDENDFIVGQFCRITSFKNIEETIRAITYLPPYVKLLLVGHGDKLNEILNLCEKELHERFQHVYYAKPETISSFYNAIDAFCLLSKGVGYARVQWESQKFGVPFIGTPVGGVSDGIVDNETGFIVNNGFEAADAIKSLILYPVLKNKIINQAKEYSEKNSSIELCVKKLEKTINEIKFGIKYI
jgi:glycosyltransferase involved in cell wall biosynthesis